jgi:hypothetical protein
VYNICIMLTLKPAKAASGFVPASGCAAIPPEPCHDTLVQLYGWDSRSSTWHGPNEFSAGKAPSTRLLVALRSAPGQSWYGPVNCCSGREPVTRLFTLVHKFADCATAMIYCNESKTGPAEILAVLPAQRRSRLRPEFAFEFLSFARFLGSVDAGAELHVHDAITAAIAETRDSDSLVFSIGSGLWPSDRDHVLSECVEKIAVTLLEWLGER